MSAPSEKPSPAIDHAKWMKQFGSWNAKKTRATTSIFDVPINLLCDVGTDDDVSVAEVFASAHVRSDLEEKGRTCRACNLSFLLQSEQQRHFKTELHRVNLKRNLAGLEPIQDAADAGSEGSAPVKGVRFAAEKEAGDSSSDEEEEVDQIYSAADYFDEDSGELQMTGRAPSEYVTAEGEARKHLSKQEGPQYIFSSQRESLSLWDFSVSAGALQGASLSAFEVRPWQLLSQAIRTMQDKNGSMWCVLILRSGRFAGAVFEGQSVLTHKVLRRYTVRAKAGGSQSSHDGQGKNAKSVGAMLRRYGEQALTEDVRALLKDWGALIQSCSAVFLSCPKTMRNVIYEDGGKDVPVRRDDPRVRLVPFMVKKPTFEEVRLVHSRLSTVRFQHRGTFDSTSHSDAVTAGSSAEQNHDGAYVAAAPPKVPAAPVPSPELPHCSASVNLFAACVSGDSERVRELLSDISQGGSEPPPPALLSDGGSSSVSDGSSSGAASDPWDLNDVLDMPCSLDSLATCLHVSSELGFGSIVSLLLAAGADPTRVDIRGRPPYFLAKTKDVRDAFRRARGAAEDLFAWDAAGVPEALTDEMEKQQREKEREKKKRSKLKKKEKDEKDLEEAKRAEVDRCEQKEMAAEEAGKRRSAAGLCAQCSRSLLGVKSLDVFDRRCCSSPCVLLLRRKLAAEAADKRAGGP